MVVWKLLTLAFADYKQALTTNQEWVRLYLNKTLGIKWAVGRLHLQVVGHAPDRDAIINVVNKSKYIC